MAYLHFQKLLHPLAGSPVSESEFQGMKLCPAVVLIIPIICALSPRGMAPLVQFLSLCDPSVLDLPLHSSCVLNGISIFVVNLWSIFPLKQMMLLATS